MAQPLPKKNQPLLDVLSVVGLTAAEFDNILQDGAEEIERLLPKLIEKYTTAGSVKAAQLLLVRRELRVVQSALWGDLGASLRSGVGKAALKAAEGAEDVMLRVFRRHNLPTGPLLAGWREQARQGIAAVLARSQNGIPLSRAVYKTQALAQGWVDRKVQQGLLLNMNAKDIAKSVAGLINPRVAGGVSYAAHRLARTEINNAYKISQENRYDEPWTKGMRWNLSRSHPRPDVCNVNASQNVHGLGSGVYPLGMRPLSHPNCLCYLTVEQVDEDEFVERLLSGQYNEYLDDLVDNIGESTVTAIRKRTR